MNGLQDDQDALKPAPATKSHSNNPASSSTTNQKSSSRHRDRDREREHHHHQEALPPFDIKQHPAAIAYAASHPGRTIPKFGPYILLQTLGEGEFGKVKLGLHSHWAEEVAVKLIRRGNVENDVRMQKIRREIAVLEVCRSSLLYRFLADWSSLFIIQVSLDSTKRSKRTNTLASF